jgi:predicted nucleotidyltransferase
MALELQDLLGRHVDILTERALHPLLRDKVVREAVPL